MKKITFILFLTFFFSGITHLTATDFAHCLHTERLKARKEGSSLDSAVKQSIKFCNSKFIENQKFQQKLGRPYFGLDLITGLKRVCGSDCDNIEEKDLHSVSGHIIDFFIVSHVSVSSGFLDSISKKYSYQDINTSIQTQATTGIEEQTYGLRLHLKATHKNGLDLYVGNGIASIVAMKKADNIGEVEKSRGTGKYTEGGLKYVSQFGWSFSYYARKTSILLQFEGKEQDLGGFMSGISIGWTF